MEAYGKPDFEQCVLGETDELFEVSTSDEVRAAALAMVRQCSRTVDIVSRHLDPQVYSTHEFVDALKQLALGNPRTRVRVLVSDPGPVVSRGHLLVETVRRLSSFMEIRVPHETHKGYNSAFLVADGRGRIYRQLAERFEGVVSFDDPREATLLIEQLDEMWQIASPDPNLRTVHV